MRVLVTGGSGFIGTNLMRSFIERGVHVLNVDWNPPLDPEQRPWWRRTDIMDRAASRMAFIEFQPTHVVHLAGADTDEKEDLMGYAQNHEGTRLLLQVVKEAWLPDRRHPQGSDRPPAGSSSRGA